MQRYKRIVVIGSVGFDHIMNLPGVFADWIMPDKIHQLNVSFTVSSMRREFGGTGGNCAYTLGLLGKKPMVVGILGMDGMGYKQHLEEAGVETSALMIDHEVLSASGQVMTDKENNQIWSYYPGPLTQLNKTCLKTLIHPSSDLVALLPSEPQAFVGHMKELVQMKARFLFDPAFFIPNLTSDELELGIRNAEIVIGNDYEIELMQKKTQKSMAQWMDGYMARKAIVIRTLGSQGSEIFQGKNTWSIPPVKVKSAADPTGAGDAYRAGFLAGYMEGKPLPVCGRMGAAAAAYTVELYGTQTHSFTTSGFKRRYGTIEA